MDQSIDTLETPRLRAEQISEKHFEDLCRLQRDAEVMKTLSASGGTLSDDEMRDGLYKSIKHWRDHAFGWWMFHDKSDARFVGRAGLKRYEIEGETIVGLGYAVLSHCWNQGFATEMAEASVKIGFERLGFTEIASWTLPTNGASQRVLEKLGFRYERDITFAGLPHRFYRLLRAAE